MRKILRIILIISLLTLIFRFDFNIDKAQAQDLIIPQEHPRIWWTPERLEQAKQWYAANPFTPRGALDTAFVYVLTNESSYARAAITSLMNFYVSEHELSAVASDTYRWGDWVPVVFDWCYDEMTPEERQNFTERYNRYVDIMRNKGWGGPGMPSSNYYWGYLRNELNWGLATYYHNPMAQIFLDHALITRWQNSFLPYANGSGKGGVPQEGGSQYGRYMLSYPVVPFTTVDLMGRDIYSETNFYKEAIFYLIYTTTPAPTIRKGSTTPYYQVFPFNDNEIAGGYLYAADGYYSNFMTTLANKWSSLPIGQYARHWINTLKPGVASYVAAVDLAGAERSYSDLPLDYYAPGIKYFHIKNSWEPDATSILLQLGKPAGVGHAHLDAGTFQIWKNGYWLSKESTGYSMSFVGGSSSSPIAHNSVLFEKKGLANAYADGPPIISRVESNSDYSYAIVDLSDAYRAHRSSHKDRDDNPYAGHVLREFVFIKPLETLVILDRLESTDEVKPAEEVVKNFIIHFPEQPEIESANSVIGNNGDQALRLTTLFPQTVTYNIVDEITEGMWGDETSYNQYRLEVNTWGQKQSYFIHVLQAKDSNGANINTQLKQDASSFTINLDHPSLGKAIVNFNKGMESVGGAIGYSDTEMPTILTPFIDKIQGIEVTDNGPVWLPRDAPSVTLTKIIDKSSANSGETLTYTLSYTNSTSNQIFNAKIEDPIPTGTTYIQNSATNNGTCTTTKCIWNLGDLAPGASGSVQFQVSVE